MEKRSLYVVVAIILIAALVLSFTGFTGKSIKNPNPETGNCIDSDKGDYPETPGTVSFTGTNLKYKDECYAEANVGPKKLVKERFCIDKLENKEYRCYNGCAENSEGEGYCNEGGYDAMVNN